MPRGSTCKAKGCTANKNDNPELSFHSFPRNKERFKLWCDLIQRPDLNHGKAFTSRMSMRVCSLHFEDRMYMNPTNKSRLIWCAVPKGVEVEGHSSQEKAESYPDPDGPESYNASCSSIPAGVLNAVTSTTKSSVCDSEDFNNSVVPSEGSLKALIQRKNDYDRQRRATDESRMPLKEVLGAVEMDQDQGHLISSKKPSALSSFGHESHTFLSLGTTAQASEDNNISNPSKTSEPMQDEFQQSFILQDPQHCNSSGPMPDTVCTNENSCEKRKADVENISEAEKGEWNEDNGYNRYFAAEESEKKDEIFKSVTWRTYPGPIQRRVVRTKAGGKRTVMIVKKASLRNLQAKGLIHPIRKYVANHIHAQQTLKKKNIIQYNLSSTNRLLKCSPSVNSVPRKGEESERKNSLVIIKKHSTDEQNFIEPDTKPSNEQHPSSHTPVQALDLQDPNKVPVTVSWANVSRSNALSFTFTVQLPAEASTPASTAEQNPPQSETFLLNNGDHSAVRNSKTQTRPSVDPSQISSSQLSNKSRTSSDLKIKDSKDLVFGTTKNSCEMNVMSSLSPEYAMQSPVGSTQLPISDHEISSNHQQLTAEESYHSSKETDVIGDCHSFEPMSLHGNVPTATQMQKHPVFQSYQGNISGLSCKTFGGVEKYHSSNRGPEGDKTVGKLTQTRPKNRENVQWIALPSISVHQQQPSPSGPTDQVEYSDSKRKNEISIIGLTSSEQPDVMYGALPIASLGQKGKMLHVTPPLKSANKELKLKYARLLNKHRHRYHLLLKKYKVLQKHFSAVKNAGTPHQVIQDARKFLSEEHVLFLESQMFLRNRPGTGNRFSRKFMKLMIEYYRRSAAGYRFLRTIFTIPSVKTIQKWLNKQVEFRNLNVNILGDTKEDSETGNDHSYLPPKTKAVYASENSNSYENFSPGKTLVQNLEYEDDSAGDYDSEESGLEDFGIEEDEQALNQLL